MLKIFILGVLAISMVEAKKHHFLENMEEMEHLAQEQCYGVIFDAGSSGTRVYVYNWPCRRVPSSNPAISIGQAAPDKKVNPGISTYFENVPGVAGYLAPLIKFAQDHVPADKIKYTPIFMGCTAGMRLLTKSQQKAILVEVRRIFRTTGFLFQQDEWARVISGRDEGAYLWLSANYMLNKFTAQNVDANKEIIDTYSTVDLGGASTQLADLLDGDDTVQEADEYKDDFKNDGGDINLKFDIYAHSWLGYGQDQARIGINKLASYRNNIPGTNHFENPCYQRGYRKLNRETGGVMQGTGDVQECRDLIRMFFRNFEHNCDQAQCGIQGEILPVITAKDKVYAASGIYYAKQFLQLPDEFTWVNLRDGYNNFCRQHYNEVLGNSNPYYEAQCFMGIYSESLLAQGYKIPAATTILSGKVNGIEPTWTLAAIFDQVDDLQGCPDSPVCLVNKFNQQLKEDKKNPLYKEHHKKQK